MKIGRSKDPVHRLRQMQTGNPRRLRVEWVLLGGNDTERLIQELWEGFSIKSEWHKAGKTRAPGTEWFGTEVRAKLEPIIATAAEQQALYLNEHPGDITEAEMERIVRLAHIFHDHVAQGRDESLFLGAGGGYVGPRRSRLNKLTA